MADSREDVLGRIRSALGTREAGAGAEYPDLPRNYARAGSLDPETRLEVFVSRLRDYDAHVVETDAASLPGTIADVLREHGQTIIVAADGLPAEMLPAGCAFVPEHEADIDTLNRCDGVVTVCTVGIASTGTIVLTHGPGEGARRLTLLPDRHLCVVRADQVEETVPEAFDRLAAFAARLLTFISGPSATADIEMTRIRGVHGPRFLDVVLVR
ncbi:MAG TPA: lactate utilization protein C [Acidobacteriaceae bacterium]